MPVLKYACIGRNGQSVKENAAIALHRRVHPIARIAVRTHQVRIVAAAAIPIVPAPTKTMMVAPQMAIQILQVTPTMTTPALVAAMIRKTHHLRRRNAGIAQLNRQMTMHKMCKQFSDINRITTTITVTVIRIMHT